MSPKLKWATASANIEAYHYQLQRLPIEREQKRYSRKDAPKEPFWSFEDGETAPQDYRGWTTILERSFAQAGKGTAFFWECRAYKKLPIVADTDGSAATPHDDETGDNIATITPARSLDMKSAYREACVRIDRIEGPQAAPNPAATEASESSRPAYDPLAAEFSNTPRLLNLTRKVADEYTSHRENRAIDPNTTGL